MTGLARSTTVAQPARISSRPADDVAETDAAAGSLAGDGSFGAGRGSVGWMGSGAGSGAGFGASVATGTGRAGSRAGWVAGNGDGRRGQRLDRQELEHEARAALASAGSGGLGERAQDRGETARRHGVGGGGEEPAARVGLGLGGHLGQVASGIGEGGDGVEGGRGIGGEVGVDEGADRRIIGEADRLADVGLGQATVGIGEDLVEQRLGVAHATVGKAGDEGQRVVIGLGALGLDDPSQLADDRRLRQAAEVVALGAADDRGRHLVGIGRGQDEDDVVRRLLDELEQRVEGVRAQHVDLVDDVDPLAELRGRRQRAHDEVAGVLDGAMRRRIDLDDVERPPLADGRAGRAGVARLAVGAEVRAVDRLGQDARGRGLAGSARPDEEVGVGQAVAAHRAAQGDDDRVLPDELREALGTEATVERGVLAGDRGEVGVGRRLGCGHAGSTVHRFGRHRPASGKGEGRGRAPGVDHAPARTHPRARLQPGCPAAPEGDRLPLLPSGPDGVHGPTLRGTRLSTSGTVVVGERGGPRPGIQLRCSGLRIQGTASSPPSTTGRDGRSPVRHRSIEA